jgi:hypothetical protein
MCGCKKDKINAVEHKNYLQYLLIKKYLIKQDESRFLCGFERTKQDLNLINVMQFEKWFLMGINGIMLGRGSNYCRCQKEDLTEDEQMDTTFKISRDY